MTASVGSGSCGVNLVRFSSPQFARLTTLAVCGASAAGSRMFSPLLLRKKVWIPE